MRVPVLFSRGYNYQLEETYKIDVGYLGGAARDDFILLSGGVLTIYKGYAWNGVSGPVRDTKRNLRASLGHDALYQLLRKSKIASSQRDACDRIFQRLCIEDGVSKWRAYSYYRVLKKFGRPGADPKNERKIYVW